MPDLPAPLSWPRGTGPAGGVAAGRVSDTWSCRTRHSRLARFRRETKKGVAGAQRWRGKCGRKMDLAGNYRGRNLRDSGKAVSENSLRKGLLAGGDRKTGAPAGPFRDERIALNTEEPAQVLSQVLAPFLLLAVGLAATPIKVALGLGEVPQQFPLLRGIAVAPAAMPIFA